jgi:hypothetical protein
MGSAVFALIFLSSGYLFLRRWHITRPHAFQWDGHALYFSVVVASLVLVVEADVLRIQIEAGSAAGSYVTKELAKLLETFATDKKLQTLGLTALWSVPIAVVSVVVLNLPLKLCSFLRTQLYLRMSCLSELEEFLLVTSTRNMPVMVTLSSNKVYVGFSMEANGARDEKEWVRLEPLLSGYRNERHEFIDTTDYGWLHQGQLPDHYKRSDFDILLPASDITSVHAFDLGIYINQFSTQGTGGLNASQRTVRPSELPLTKSERFYWAFFACLCLIVPVSYFSGYVVSAFMILLTTLFAAASVLDE